MSKRHGCRHFHGKYWRVYLPDHPNANRAGFVYEHVLIAAKALGKPLPKGAHVHHVNEVKTDNRPENLVVCQDGAYHRLLHRRTWAMQASGHADWRKCWLCKVHDSPDNLYISENEKATYHKACVSEYYFRRKNANLIRKRNKRAA